MASLARFARTAAVRVGPMARVAAPSSARLLSTAASSASAAPKARYGSAALAGLALATSYAAYEQRNRFAFASAAKADWDQIRKEIVEILENYDYDDGSYGPVLVRLAWHSSGTYDMHRRDGGSNGAHMRFEEAKHGGNAGLQVARDLLEPIKRRHPEISYADLWTFAGKVAIEEMGGPTIPWRPGRTDAKDGSTGTPDGRLPDAAKGKDHVREVFYRMGFNDREIVALIGAHAVGRAHRDRSGYEGPWTRAPTSFTNEFFRELVENKWTPKKWNGPKQFEDPTGELMMLPADMALLEDPEFKKYVLIFAKDQDAFFAEFARAFAKLLELGVPFDKQ